MRERLREREKEREREREREKVKGFAKNVENFVLQCIVRLSKCFCECIIGEKKFIIELVFGRKFFLLLPILPPNLLPNLPPFWHQKNPQLSSSFNISN